ncbi:MAG: Flp family type IVb pilin [Hyphomicrobiales bacterium]|nr:Flp family type IVb pilin [Hyphomicrobiales bacterium]MCP5371604.1 Flp family type IVb pilin [Hyphomicrobiales bacterium]
MKPRLIGKFIKDDLGTTAMEYCLIAALVSVVAVGTLKGMGISLITLFTTVHQSVESGQPT